MRTVQALLFVNFLLLAGCTAQVSRDNPCLTADPRFPNAAVKNDELNLFGHNMDQLAQALLPLFPPDAKVKPRGSRPTGKFVAWVVGEPPGPLDYQGESGGLQVNLGLENAARCWADVEAVALIRSRPSEKREYRNTDQFGKPMNGGVTAQFYDASVWVVELRSHRILAYREFTSSPPQEGKIDENLLRKTQWAPINDAMNWLAGY